MVNKGKRSCLKTGLQTNNHYSILLYAEKILLRDCCPRVNLLD